MGPLFHFNCINFKVSLIKIINFNVIKNMAHLVMLVIFHAIVIICQNFNLPHIYRIFVKKISFLRWKFSNLSQGIQTWFKLCEMTWFNIPSTFIKTKNHLSVFWNKFVFLSTHVHYICFHKYTPISHFVKWNKIISFLISCLDYILT
jgi:hypothetical protein